MDYPMYAWSLTPPNLAAEEIEFDPDVEEVLIRGHPLEPVNIEDSQPNGRFRFIVKLRLGFRESKAKGSALKEYSGTGWLVAKDLVVTAGHNVSHAAHGRAESVRAFIGYENRSSIENPPDGMEERNGHLVATPAEWHFHRTVKFDVAFLRLERSFNKVRPIQYIQTPDNTEQNLLVVGYPGDAPGLFFNGRMCYGEGRYFSALSSEPYRGLIKHTVSTYYGSSGSPVLLEENGHFISIGTHRGGSSKGQYNLATAIGKHVDVRIDYREYIDLLEAIASERVKIESDRSVFAYQAGEFPTQQKERSKADRNVKSTRDRGDRYYRRNKREGSGAGKEEHEDEEFEDTDKD